MSSKYFNKATGNLTFKCDEGEKVFKACDLDSVATANLTCQAWEWSHFIHGTRTWS